MTPRQARRERREAERKTKKLELKKARQASAAWWSATENRQVSAPPLPGVDSGSRLAEKHPLAAPETYPQIQPRWNPELDDEFPREVQIRNNAEMDLRALQLGLPIPPPGPTPNPLSLRAARKKAAAATPKPAAAPTEDPSTEDTQKEMNFVSQNPPKSPSKSTGPRSPEGKFASSRNSTKHGLASGTVLIPGEDPAPFEALLNDFLAEHQPATPTQEVLVQEMAQSYWLAQRAIRLQNECFTAEGVDQKQLALFLRYQTTHDRRFYKALNTLRQLQKIGFVSQPQPTPVADSGFVSQSAGENTHTHQFVSQNDHFEAREEVNQHAA